MLQSLINIDAVKYVNNKYSGAVSKMNQGHEINTEQTGKTDIYLGGESGQFRFVSSFITH